MAGIVISLIYAELTGLSPAGLVVPGYIALCLWAPQRIAYTLLIAAAAWGASKLLENVLILYGRRRFAVMILLSYFLSLLVLHSGVLPYDPGVIGYLVPGIMAQEFEKQGLFKSLVSLGIVVGILALVMLWQGVPVL
jgi:poly-gamma-glutamate biosynthesis protein PgsC/CapC